MLIKMSRYATSTLITLMHDSEKYPVCIWSYLFFSILKAMGVRIQPNQPVIMITFALRSVWATIAGSRGEWPSPRSQVNAPERIRNVSGVVLLSDQRIPILPTGINRCVCTSNKHVLSDWRLPAFVVFNLAFEFFTTSAPTTGLLSSGCELFSSCNFSFFSSLTHLLVDFAAITYSWF